MHSNPASRQNIPRQMCHLQPCSAAKTLVTRVHSVPDNYQFRPPAYSTNATTADDKQDEDTGKSPAETSPSNIPALQLPLPQINLPSSSQESIPDAMATQGTMGNASISSMDSSTGKQLSQLSASPRDTFSSMSGGSGGHGSNGPNLTSSESDRSAKTIVPKEQHHVPMSLTVPNNPLIQIQEPIDDKDTKPPQREDVSLPNYRPYSSDSSEELKRLARSESEEETRKYVDSRHKCSPTKGVKKHRRRASGSPRNCSSSGGSHSVSPAPSRSSSDSDEQAATSPQKRKRTRRRSRNPSPVSGLLTGEKSGRKSPQRGAEVSDIPKLRVEPMRQQESEVYWDSHKGPVQETNRGEDRASPTQFEDAPSPTPETEQNPSYVRAGVSLHIEEPGDVDKNNVTNTEEYQV
ncbi:uncharacterized protein [Amphiura filiformis]|uniref:uncharacterized protein n=1 Tax=Amphiura filiformis TaxID=82378 RepID=UPI003B21A7C3